MRQALFYRIMMKNNRIDSGQPFDFGRTSDAYAAYRDIYPPALYDRLKSSGVAADGTAWLDLGTGTGVLPKNLYNPKASITGADISPEQIAFAKEEAEESGRNITYIAAPAEETGLPDRSFDTITAAQCFWYFDREKIRGEIRRLLKPGGIFIKIFMNWDESDAVAGGSCELVRRFNPQWNSAEAAVKDITDDLFPGRHTETFYADLPFTRESWHGRMLACRGTLASMDAAALSAWQEAHLRFLESQPESFTVRHIIYISYFRL